MNRRIGIGLMALAAASCFAAAPLPVRAEEGATLTAMQMSYEREINSALNYLEFAFQADLERRAAIACLFFAAARAESVHAASHAAAIVQLGGRPVWSRQPIEVGRTADNLRTSILLELAERTFVYRRFADLARAECLYEALASINFARNAESTHEVRFREALANLELEREAVPDGIAFHVAAASMPLPESSSPSKTYFVCLGDGSMFARPVEGWCPNCHTSTRRIVAMSCRP